jgi:3-mercaptopyruvate sulfurtransferase SseA
LLRKGVLRVRPLKGGIETWRELGFPLEPMNVERAATRSGY